MVQLFNPLGALVAQQTVKAGTTAINVDGLAKGLYLLTLRTENGLQSRHIVVQ